MKLKGYWMVMLAEPGRSKEVFRNSHDVELYQNWISFVTSNGTVHFSNSPFHLRSEPGRAPESPSQEGS